MPPFRVRKWGLVWVRKWGLFGSERCFRFGSENNRVRKYKSCGVNTKYFIKCSYERSQWVIPHDHIAQMTIYCKTHTIFINLSFIKLYGFKVNLKIFGPKSGFWTIFSFLFSRILGTPFRVRKWGLFGSGNGTQNGHFWVLAHSMFRHDLQMAYVFFVPIYPLFGAKVPHFWTPSAREFPLQIIP